MDKIWTKEEIRHNLLTKDNWLYRGIIAIYNNQTSDEQESDTTKHNNGIGFNGCDAEILSSFARQLYEFGKLSDKQKIVARKKMPKYSKQLERMANKEVEA